MPLNFDLDRLRHGTGEFFFEEGRRKTPVFGAVLIDNSIRDALIAGVHATWDDLQAFPDGPVPYDPGNDYPSRAYLQYPLDGPLVAYAKVLHHAHNLDEVQNPEQVLPRIKLYAVRLEDEDGKFLTAVKSISSFGRPVGKSWLARLTNGELHLVDQPEFQLANDFDFLIDEDTIHIYHPGKFETACRLQDSIKASAKENLDHLSQQIPFIDFAPFEAEILRSTRSAREFATIKANDYGRDLDQQQLLAYCTDLNIGYLDEDGVISIDPQHHSLFIRLVARKILSIQLRSEPEVFAVASRTPYTR